MKNEQTLVAAFDDRNEAELAVSDLEAAGFDEQQIGFVLRGSDVGAGGMITDEIGAKDASGAVTGALGGGMVGGILAAAAALLIPGVGPILAGGVLASFFGGAIAGTAIGGILGALTGLGISEEEARFYEQEFKAGKAIVAVKTQNRIEDAREILQRHGGYHFEMRPRSPIETRGTFSEP